MSFLIFMFIMINIFAKIQKTIVSSEESSIFPLRKAKTNFVFVSKSYEIDIIYWK